MWKRKKKPNRGCGWRRKSDQSWNTVDTYLVESWGYYLNYAPFEW